MRQEKIKKVNLFNVFKTAVKGYRKTRVSREGNISLQQVELQPKKEIAPSIGIIIPEVKKAEKAMQQMKTIGKKVIEEKQQDINISYPLIPKRPLPGQKIFAYATIKWSSQESALVYVVSEPALTAQEKILLEQIKSSLIEKLDVDFTKLRKGEANKYLRKGFEETISLMAAELPAEKQQEILYYVERDFIGLGRIEPFMQDPNIEDISCDGVHVPIYIYHRNSRVGSVRTNIIFESSEDLDTFINKLAQRCGKTITVASPLVDASLPDGSRIQLTLGTDIAKRGSNFCIKEGYVQMHDGLIEDIKELFENWKQIYGSKIDEYGNEISIPPNIYASGVHQENLEQEKGKVLQILKLPPPDKLVRVSFEECGNSASSLEVTKNHMFHILTEEGIKTIEAEKLNVGMWAPVPAKIDVECSFSRKEFIDMVLSCLSGFDSSKTYVKIDSSLKREITYSESAARLKDIKRSKITSIPLAELIKNLELKGKSAGNFKSLTCILREGKKGRGSAIQIPFELTKNLAYFVGWVIGDGTLTRNNVSIDTGLNEKHKEYLLKVIRELFAVEGKTYKNCKSRIYINSSIAAKILHEVFRIPYGYKSRKVDVPKIIQKSGNKLISAFLKGLFEADGSFEININLTTYSKALATKVIFLLTRFGVYSSFNHDGNAFRVYIPSAYYERFSKAIFSNDKIEKLVAHHKKTKKSNMLPAFLSDIALKQCRKNGAKWGSISKILNPSEIRKSGKVSFKKLKEFNEFLKKYGETETTKMIDRLLKGDIEFKKISGVEILENENKSPVYDISCNPVSFYIGGKDRPLFVHDTIRKFTEEPLSPIHLMKFRTADSRILAYLWMLIEFGKSTLIGGGTATGKTSLLNALSLFIKPELKIVTIEDTSELRLPHTHWVPQVARQPMVEVAGRKIGEVDMFDLLRESFRQRPDFIIVGEVRGKEAYVLFQQITSVPGNEKVAIVNDNHFKKIPIEELAGKKFRTFTLDPQTEKICIKEAILVKHLEVDELIKIKTKTGREITATPAHSFFTYENGLVPVFGKDLKEGSKIVVPAALPCGYNNIKYLNLMDIFPDIRVYSPELIKRASRKLGFKTASEIVGFTTISNYYGVNNCALPTKAFIRLMEVAGIEHKKEMEKVKLRFERNSSLSETRLEISPEFLRLLGYYVSEGSINTAKGNNSISLYNKNEKILSDMRNCIKKVSGKKPRERITYGLGTATELTFNHKTVFEILKRFCGNRSEKKRIPNLIFGLSKERIGEFLSALYSGDGYLRTKEFGYCTCSKELADDLMFLLLTFNIVASIKKGKGTNQPLYEILMYNAESQERFLEFIKPFRKIPKLKKKVKTNNKDIFIDKIKNIEMIRLKKPESVYDISVEGMQNFIGGMGGILLHNTGHPGLATIHADTTEKLVDRLITPPIELPPSLMENLDVIIFLVRVKYGNRYVRRVSSIFEITGFDREKNAPITNEIFRWNPAEDRFETLNASIILKKISEASGISEISVKKSIDTKIKVLDWLAEKNFTDYRIFAKIMKLYYTEQDRLTEIMSR